MLVLILSCCPVAAAPQTVTGTPVAKSEAAQQLYVNELNRLARIKAARENTPLVRGWKVVRGKNGNWGKARMTIPVKLSLIALPAGKTADTPRSRVFWDLFSLGRRSVPDGHAPVTAPQMPQLIENSGKTWC